MFSPWMIVQPNGTAVGASPFARLCPNFVTSSSMLWRYDPDNGYIEYQGQIRAAADIAFTGGRAMLLECWLDELPTTSMKMLTHSTAYFPTGSLSMPLRIDWESPGDGRHHYLTLVKDSGRALPTNWRLMLNLRYQMPGNADPRWLPWATLSDSPMPGVSVAFNGVSPYPNGQYVAEVRCTPDYKEWEWRGIVQNSGGIWDDGVVLPIMTITHPNAAAGLTQGPLMVTCAGANQEVHDMGVARIDVDPTATGHVLKLVAPRAAAAQPDWIVMPRFYAFP